MGSSLQAVRPAERSAPSSAISPEAVRAQLEKILSSATFKGAKSQSSLLRYVVEEALAGRADSIKEYSIGVEAFGKGEDFDPRLNNIVRVEAQRVRLKLAKYYELEGSADTIRIQLPKGGYAPVWTETSTSATSTIRVGLGNRITERSLFRSENRKWMIILSCLGVSLGIISLSRYSVSRSLSSLDARSVAVMPFANLSDNREDEYFADGLSEDITDSLARLPGLRVVARRSASQYKGKRIDIREIGRVLGVRAVIEGSVRKFGNHLRVTAQLIDASNGYQLWAEEFDRQWNDALAIQQEISAAVTAALGIELTERGLAARLRTETSVLDPEVYRNVLKGRYFWNKNTVDSVKTGIGYFEQAIAKDPDYAPAYIGLARCYTALPALSGLPPLSMIPKMRAAALKAIELDATLGEAHMDLAEADLYEFDWRGAERELQKALELTPDEAVVHRWYGYYLQKTGKLEQALVEATKALELDPVSPYMAVGVAESLYHLRRYREAMEEYRKAAALDPNFAMLHGGLGQVYVQLGMYSQAIAEFQKEGQTSGDSLRAGYIGYTYARWSKAAHARQVLSALLLRAKSEFVPALGIALVYTGLGDKDHAFLWLQKAAAQHEVTLSPKADPMLDSLRSDARFQELLRQMKLI